MSKTNKANYTSNTTARVHYKATTTKKTQRNKNTESWRKVGVNLKVRVRCVFTKLKWLTSSMLNGNLGWINTCVPNHKLVFMCKVVLKVWYFRRPPHNTGEIWKRSIKISRLSLPTYGVFRIRSSNRRNLKTPAFRFGALKTELFEIDDVTIIMWFPCPGFLKHKSKMTGDWCVFKFLRRNVDGALDLLQCNWRHKLP